MLPRAQRDRISRTSRSGSRGRHGVISAEQARRRAALTIVRIKTGEEPVPLPLAVKAVGILKDLPCRADSPWVFPGHDPERHLSTVNHLWLDVRARAGLEDVRLHDLRHSFASQALALGETLSVIGKLLGHSDIETTARYAHLARDSLREAAERVAGSIAADIL